jgi:hypothetical protein
MPRLQTAGASSDSASQQPTAATRSAAANIRSRRADRCRVSARSTAATSIGPASTAASRLLPRRGWLMRASGLDRMLFMSGTPVGRIN